MHTFKISEQLILIFLFSTNTSSPFPPPPKKSGRAEKSKAGRQSKGECSFA